MVTHSSVLAWRIPGVGEPGGADVYGVAQSRTRLRRLSSSSSSSIDFGWRRQWQPTPVLLPGKSHGRRSLVGCSHGVAKCQTRLSDFTFTFHFHALEEEMATHSSVLAWRIPGTGEPPGCWWTAVFGVAQSRTRLKQLSGKVWMSEEFI